ncbi:MAG: TonB-dependent receptor, partial [Cryobacterium sp.]|nr:TonB-dependent receptor [Cryobacterium sp.]
MITDGHRLELTAFSDKQTQKTRYTRFDPTTGTLQGVQGNVINKFGGINWIGTYTGQFTDWFTLSASYGRNKDRGIQVASPNTEFGLSRLVGCVPAPCETGTSSVAYGTVQGAFADKDERRVWRVDADFYVDLFGSHHFRAGTDYETLRAEELTTRAGGSGFSYDFRATQTRRRFYLNEGKFETNMRAVYLQDSWSLLNDRVNLQLGVRGDKFRNYSVTGALYYDSGYNWAPRLGATIDVFGDKKTKLNLFYGRYFLPIATNTNIRLGGRELFFEQRQNYAATSDLNGDGVPDIFTFDANGNINNFTANSGSATCPAGTPAAGQICRTIFSDGIAGPTDTLVSSTLKPSETDEIIVGVSHRFGNGWSAGVDYVRRRLLETLEDVAVDAAVLAYCADNGITGCSSVFTGYHQYVLANPGSDITVRLDGDCSIAGQCDVVTLKKEDLGYPKAVRKYDAVQFTLDKAYNGFYSFNANYVYTKLRGNFEGGVKSDNNQTDTGLTQDFDQPGFVDGAYGDLANGRKHAFKLYGRVTPVKGVDVGINAVLESPRKFSCIGPYNNDNTNFAYYYGAASYYCRQPEFGGDPTTPVGGGTGS